MLPLTGSGFSGFSGFSVFFKSRIYRDTILLTPGEFSDSITMSPVNYTADELAKSATNWSANYLNVDHCFEVNKRLGFINNPYWDGNSVKGDLFIFPSNLLHYVAPFKSNVERVSISFNMKEKT